MGADGKATNQVNITGTDMRTIIGVSGGYNANLNATNTIDVNTSANAFAVLNNLDTAIGKIAETRATYGAVQNRFDAVISNLQNYSENLTAARSRIMDADFAAETAKLTRAQIMQQAGTSILGQANQIPQGALSLLQ